MFHPFPKPFFHFTLSLSQKPSPLYFSHRVVTLFSNPHHSLCSSSNPNRTTTKTLPSSLFILSHVHFLSLVAPSCSTRNPQQKIPPLHFVFVGATLLTFTTRIDLFLLFPFHSYSTTNSPFFFRKPPSKPYFSICVPP